MERMFESRNTDANNGLLRTELQCYEACDA